MRLDLLSIAAIGLSMSGLVQAQERGARGVHPQGNPGRWFDYSDYPAAARAAGEQGKVKVALAVDATGSPTSCTVLESSGSTLLDDGTCEVAMKNARLTPATDAAGAPVASLYVVPAVSWALGDAADGPNKPLKLSEAPAVFELSSTIIDVDADGKVVGCRALNPAKTAPLCDNLKSGRQITGPITRNGTPSSALVTVTQTMSVIPISRKP